MSSNDPRSYSLFNFHNPSAEELARIGSVLMQSRDQVSATNAMLAPLMEGFGKFLQETLMAIADRARKLGKLGKLEPMPVDYDPNSDKDRFIREGWNFWADTWALIETPVTYQVTMRTFLEKVMIPQAGRFRIVSLGSGPGIYEIFLARLLLASGLNSSVTMVDFSADMAEVRKFIAFLNPPLLTNVHSFTSDMAHMPVVASESADVVICNNSLQWCPRWKQAVAEMARILDKRSQCMLHLVIHTHDQPMFMRDGDNRQVIDMHAIPAEVIMDELEKNSFTLRSSRQIHSAGSGQAGGDLTRVYLVAELTPGGPQYSWRKRKAQTVSATAFSLRG